MPKRYEDEIRDLLKGMDRFPGEGGSRRGGGPRRPGSPSGRSPLPGMGRGLRWDPQRMMGGALILMLLGWVLRIMPVRAFPAVTMLAGVISLASMVLFIVALVLFLRMGGMGGMSVGSTGSSQRPMWRGQVIEFPRRGGPMTGLRNWWRRALGRFSRRPSGPNGPFPRGHDTYQW